MRERRDIFCLFVDRPVLTLMVALAMVLVGVVAFTKLPLRLVPEGLSDNKINVWIPIVTDRTPTEVEEKVAKPFEEQLRTIPGIKEVESDSDEDSAFFKISLDSGIDPTLASAEVRDRAQRARLLWPEDVDRYFTWREDASSAPLAFFQMLTPQRNPEWDVLIDKVLKPRLEAVDGVGRVDMWGLLDETIRIWFDRDKLVAHRIDYYQLIQRLSRDNFARPIGEIDDGQHRYLARVDTKFRSLEEIQDYPIKAGLVLGDIARVERVPSVRDSLSRYNQKYTYSGMVRAAAGTNPVDASSRLRGALEQLQEDPRLAGLEYRFLFDQGEMITDSLETLLSTSIQGGCLALIALLLFLRNLRFTLAIALAIPMALLIVGGFLFFSGDSLNILTMAGMTLAVGMVVDNSVVVLENIRRLRDQGMSLRDACIQGPREVGLAVSMATMTTVVVILPMVFIGDGQARIMLGAVGIPLSVALIGSLAVGLLLMPSGLRQFGGEGGLTSRSEKGWSKRAARFSPVQLLLRFNQWLLRASLRHRVLATLGAFLCLMTFTVPLEQLEFVVGGGDMWGSGNVRISLELPKGLDLPDVEREVTGYEDFLLEHKEEWNIDSVSSRFSRRSISLDLVLDDSVPRSEYADYRYKIEEVWPRRPGVKVRLSDGGSSSMGGGDDSASRDASNFVLRLYGRDSRYLMDLARDVRDRLAVLPEVASVEIPQMDDTQEVVVAVDRDRMQEVQVMPEVLFGTIASGLQGRVLTEFEEKSGRETRLIAEFDSERNPSLLDLKDTEVYSGGGIYQRLSTLSDIQFRNSMGAIERVDGRTNVSIVGRRAEGIGPAAFSGVLGQVMRRYPLPRGYSWSDESLFLESQEQVIELVDALLLGVTLVFLLMGVLFESVILPGAILFTVPFALLGAVWNLYFFYGSLDPMVVVGMILLSGIVVNNGIVLLDCIARLRKTMDREAAILEGTRQRLRPIVMTAVTTCVGLLPMALFGESSGQGLSYVSLSITVAGGLAFCTIFTAFVVPLAYTFMDDLSLWLRRVWRQAIPGGALALGTHVRRGPQN